MQRRSSALFVSALSALLVLGAAAPATAVAPLPSGDEFYAIPCNTGDLGLKRVNTVDSTWVQVGTQTTVSDVGCAYQAAFNPVTKQSYFIGGNTVSEDWPLVQIDVTTGDYTVIHEIWDGATNLSFPLFGANFPGNMFITSAGAAYFIGGTKLYPLDLATGIIGAQIGADLVVSGDIYATACAMSAPTCYILTEIGQLYTIDPTTGVVSGALGALPVSGSYTLQVASDGTLWTNTGGTVSSFLASDPAGTFEIGASTPLYSGSYLITDGLAAPAAVVPPAGPTLAAAGTDSAVPAIGAAVLAALGGILVFWSRRRAAARA